MYSLVMLVEDAETDFTPYLSNLHNHLDRLGISYELLLAVNGPSQFARECLNQWPGNGSPINIVELTRKVPSGICLQTVLPECQGQILIICGPYQQIDDSGLETLLDAVARGEADLALPWRRNRVDAAVNQWQSRLFNWLVRRLTGSTFHDLSSTLRIVQRKVLEETPLYGDLYRYLPLLAKHRGFRVQEFPAKHAEERGRIGYYGIREYVSRFVDLMAMHFNFRFSRKPLRYFGLRGLILIFIGLLCMGSALVMKITGFAAIGDSPLLMIALVLILAGSVIWGIGLLGEILTFVLGRKRKDYIVEKILE